MRRDPIVFFSLVGISIVLLITGATYALWEPSFVVSYASGATLGTFLLFGYDKGIAGSDRMRVPERVFYGLAIIGGSLGLLLGMKFFRHKTRKAIFQFYLALVLITQIILMYYLV